MIKAGEAFCKKYFPSKFGEWMLDQKNPESYTPYLSDHEEIDEGARILYSMTTSADGSMDVKGYLIVQRTPGSLNKIKRILGRGDPDKPRRA